MKSTINLFKVVPITHKKSVDKTTIISSIEETIDYGFIFSPDVIANYPDLTELTKTVEKVLGLSKEQANASFHKSWGKVKNVSDIQLLIEQMLHYITTYGFESMGIYNESSVYIPAEKLEIPDLKEDIKLIVINGLTKEEIKEKLLSLLSLGVALKEETKQDVLDVATYVDLNEREVSAIKNKEVKIALYEYLNIIPKNGLEFLRYAVYKATGETLLIKNQKLIDMIKGCKNLSITALFNNYKKENGLEPLAEIFYRFKPLFLAFRTSVKMKIIINKIRRLAVKNHKPMKSDFLNDVTGLIKKDGKIDFLTLSSELDGVNTFRKIRLAYALKYRTKEIGSILYKIRNGKGYSTDFSFDNKDEAKKVLNFVLDSIVADLKKNVEGKKIYIPDYINYSLPATEKQFSGNFPSGSFISVPTDMVVGVHWENQGDTRVDLDLSSISVGEKIGWDSYYRDEDRNILFSGDVTNAPLPNGASELLYVKKQVDKSLLVSLNYFNHRESNASCPFKIFIAKENIQDFNLNYMVNPNNIITSVPSVIDEKQRVLGLLVSTPEESRFYFSEVNIGDTRSANTVHSERSRKYLIGSVKDSIELKDLLEKAGAVLVRAKENAFDDDVIDLSPENLEKDTILKMLS